MTRCVSAGIVEYDVLINSRLGVVVAFQASQALSWKPRDRMRALRNSALLLGIEGDCA